MQIIKREELPEQRQVRLTIAVDKDTWQASLAKCYQGVKSVCPVAGEPTRENLEQAYGPEFLYQEAVNDTYPQALVEAIENLPEREKYVMAMYYEHDMNLKEIAAVLEVTESRISQLHSQAIARLRTKMRLH